MILDIPRFKCFVKNQFITNGEQQLGATECYAFAVTLIEARPILFTIHTIDGAVYSRLPIWALQANDKAVFASGKTELDVWGAISSDGQVIEHQYLKDYEVKVKLKSGVYNGRYLFTIDYFTGGFAQDPEQHKTSNIILLDNGLYAAAPNNDCLFVDDHFTGELKEFPKHYRRNETYFRV